jgi:hypothetical protein
MKHLTDYINEQLNIEEINESNEKWYRFTTKDYTDQSIIDNMERLAKSGGFYVENIDGGVKVRLDDDKVSKLAGLVTWLEEYVEIHKDEEKSKDAVEDVQKLIDDMKKDIEKADADAKQAEEDAKKEAEEKEKEAEEAARKAKEEAEKKAAEDAKKAMDGAK